MPLLFGPFANDDRWSWEPTRLIEACARVWAGCGLWCVVVFPRPATAALPARPNAPIFSGAMPLATELPAGRSVCVWGVNGSVCERCGACASVCMLRAASCVAGVMRVVYVMCVVRVL